MKTNPTIETASASLIADYLRELYSITETHAANECSLLWHILWQKIISDGGIYDAIMKRFDNFGWVSAEYGYESYKDECEDFIASFIDFAAGENEDLLPSFDDYIKHHI